MVVLLSWSGAACWQYFAAIARQSLASVSAFLLDSSAAWVGGGTSCYGADQIKPLRTVPALSATGQLGQCSRHHALMHCACAAPPFNLVHTALRPFIWFFRRRAVACTSLPLRD